MLQLGSNLTTTWAKNEMPLDSKKRAHFKVLRKVQGSQRKIIAFDHAADLTRDAVAKSTIRVTNKRADFDPGGFYSFDLGTGTVETPGGARVLVASVSLLEPLISAAAASGDLTPVRAFGQSIAENMGADSLTSLTPEEALSKARTALALYGWGELQVTRWGDALALRLAGMPNFDDRRLAGAAFLGGFFTGLSKHDTACVPVGDDEYMLVDPSIADAVWKSAQTGKSTGQLAAALQGGR